MKNKTKVIVGLAAMLAGTIGVAGVSTFAWFTTQNTAVISFADAHVVSDNASILIQYENIANNGITSTMVTSGYSKAESAVTIAGASVECRDISGDGKAFYRPTWTTWNVTASAMTDVSASHFAPTKQYYVTFGIALTNKGKADTKVFIGNGSKIEPKNTGDTQDEGAVKATRVSVYDGAATGAQTDLRTIWQYDVTDGSANTNYHYIAKDSTVTVPANGAYNFAGYKLANPAAETMLFGAPSAATYVTDTKGQLVHTFTTQNEVTHLTISMWIEGTLAAATDAVIDGYVKMTMNLEAYAGA